MDTASRYRERSASQGGLDDATQGRRGGVNLARAVAANFTSIVTRCSDASARRTKRATTKRGTGFGAKRKACAGSAGFADKSLGRGADSGFTGRQSGYPIARPATGRPRSPAVVPTPAGLLNVLARVRSRQHRPVDEAFAGAGQLEHPPHDRARDGRSACSDFVATQRGRPAMPQRRRTSRREDPRRWRTCRNRRATTPARLHSSHHIRRELWAVRRRSTDRSSTRPFRPKSDPPRTRRMAAPNRRSSRRRCAAS